MTVGSSVPPPTSYCCSMATKSLTESFAGMAMCIRLVSSFVRCQKGLICSGDSRRCSRGIGLVSPVMLLARHCSQTQDRQTCCSASSTRVSGHDPRHFPCTKLADIKLLRSHHEVKPSTPFRSKKCARLPSQAV